MKKTINTAAISCLVVLSTSAWAASGQADYSKCRDFLTPQAKGAVSSGFNANPAGYLPFDIEDDGSIKPHDDVVSYEQNKDGGNEVITYEIPSYMTGISGNIPVRGGFYRADSSDSNKRTNPYRVDMRKVEVRIERDEQGNISEIITDNNFSEGELKGIQDRISKHQLENMNEQMRNNMRSYLGDEEFKAPIHQRAGANISLRVQNGECVPIEHEERFLIEPKPEGRTVDRSIYNTELCHDINDFLNEHPETAACFNPDLNNKMVDIFKKYHKPQEMIGFGGAGIGGGFGGMGGMMGGPYGYPSDLESLLMSYSMRGGNDEMNQQFEKAAGRSPVIASHTILQGCYNMGLGSFIDDPTLWEEAGAVSNTSSGSDPSSAVPR